MEDRGKFYFVFFIAAVDKTQHLNALLQLMKLAGADDPIHTFRTIFKRLVD